MNVTSAKCPSSVTFAASPLAGSVMVSRALLDAINRFVPVGNGFGTGGEWFGTGGEWFGTGGDLVRYWSYTSGEEVALKQLI
jgi:hypothetical protein